jgi:hypothetical protein
MIMSALRASIVFGDAHPRPSGRGYFPVGASRLKCQTRPHDPCIPPTAVFNTATNSRAPKILSCAVIVFGSLKRLKGMERSEGTLCRR